MLPQESNRASTPQVFDLIATLPYATALLFLLTLRSWNAVAQVNSVK
jgi:hypothetical protein